ncbi:hypothetical protein K9M48_05330 [Candidatus Gracilibacteria bacterium]|nr:hypothetical protein [Candidatus Gracilibacteria bacterium]
MIYTLSKKILIGLLILSSFPIVNAADLGDSDFYIIPPSEDANIGDKVIEIGSEGGNVIEKYKDAAYGEKDANGNRPNESNLSLGDQLASGIMNRDTLLDYVTYIVRFLLQIGLVIGAGVMIYLGYQKITEFREFKAGGIKYVIVGIFIIGFAYVIVRTLVSMFIN